MSDTESLGSIFREAELAWMAEHEPEMVGRCASWEDMPQNLRDATTAGAHAVATAVLVPHEQTENHLADLLYHVRGAVKIWDAGFRGVALTDDMRRLKWTYERIAAGGHPSTQLPLPASIGVMQERVGEWARQTFPSHSILSIIAHILEEAHELLLTELYLKPGPRNREIGGLAILLMTLCDVTETSLAECIQVEHERNLASEWAPDVRGMVHRVKEPTPEPVPDSFADVIRKMRRALQPEDHGRFSVNHTDGEEFIAAIDARWPGTARNCRVCGCTDDNCNGCVERTGEPCHWVEPDLCSACVEIPAPAPSETAVP